MNLREIEYVNLSIALRNPENETWLITQTRLNQGARDADSERNLQGWTC
jgi:hypothetical protein